MNATDDQALPLIMIADDDEDGRCLLKSVLELKGFDVIEAADGQEAIDLAAEWLPDLLLIELKLPVVSGFTVIRRVRKNADLRDTPIIAFSFNRPTCHSRLALAAGSSAHLEKPMDLDQLELLIDRLVPGDRLQWASMLIH